MISLPRIISLPIAVVGLLAAAAPASASWNSVFLVSCNDCTPRPIRRAFASPSLAPSQPQEVQYEQKCYYEPVKILRAERYTEEVPVRVKSYYWDPVTTYSYRSYYDSCSNQCQQIAVPRTSYVRKEQCDTVMKAVERTRMVPVEVARKVCETRPVVTYYGPTTRTYGPLEPIVPSGSTPVPRVDEFRSPPPGVMPKERETIAPQQLPTSSVELSKPKTPPATSNYPKTNAFSTSHTVMKTMIRGEVVAKDQQTPLSGAKLVFVSAGDHNLREYAKADEFGGFDLKLPPGDWHMYVGSGNGQASYFKKITINEGEARNFTVVNR